MSDNSGERSLAETRRSVEQTVIEALVTRQSCADVDRKILLYGVLSDVRIECPRAERIVGFRVLRIVFRRDNTIFKIRVVGGIIIYFCVVKRNGFYLTVILNVFFCCFSSFYYSARSAP